jgi:hypothetical protein
MTTQYFLRRSCPLLVAALMFIGLSSTANSGPVSEGFYRNPEHVQPPLSVNCATWLENRLPAVHAATPSTGLTDWPERWNHAFDGKALSLDNLSGPCRLLAGLIEYEPNGDGKQMLSPVEPQIRHDTIASISTAVPEPETYAVLVSGLFLVAIAVIRHQRHRLLVATL